MSQIARFARTLAGAAVLTPLVHATLGAQAAMTTKPRYPVVCGKVVFEGTPAELVKKKSTLTGKHLAEFVAR